MQVLLLRANKLSGVVAHDLSGLLSAMEVLNETDRMATGDSTDEI